MQTVHVGRGSLLALHFVCSHWTVSTALSVWTSSVATDYQVHILLTWLAPICVYMYIQVVQAGVHVLLYLHVPVVSVTVWGSWTSWILSWMVARHYILPSSCFLKISYYNGGGASYCALSLPLVRVYWMCCDSGSHCRDMTAPMPYAEASPANLRGRDGS